MKLVQRSLRVVALTALLGAACTSTRSDVHLRDTQEDPSVPDECVRYAEKLRQCFPTTKSLSRVEQTFETKGMSAPAVADMKASCAEQSRRLDASCLHAALAATKEHTR